jgi:hypothetical protein
MHVPYKTINVLTNTHYADLLFVLSLALGIWQMVYKQMLYFPELEEDK